jgi:hypothetical protein
VGTPAAAVARTTAVVAARGTHNTLRLRMMHNGTWGQWTSWGGTLSASPAITGGRDGRIDAFVRGADNALWTRRLRSGHPLTAWKRLGGHLSTAPAAVTFGNSLEVAAGGTNHAVWLASTDSKWAWTSADGRTYSAPAIGYIPQSNGAGCSSMETATRSGVRASEGRLHQVAEDRKQADHRCPHRRRDTRAHAPHDRCGPGHRPRPVDDQVPNTRWRLDRFSPAPGYPKADPAGGVQPQASPAGQTACSRGQVPLAAPQRTS